MQVFFASGAIYPDNLRGMDVTWVGNGSVLLQNEPVTVFSIEYTKEVRLKFAAPAFLILLQIRPGTVTKNLAALTPTRFPAQSFVPRTGGL